MGKVHASRHVVLSCLDVPEGRDVNARNTLASAELRTVSDTYHSTTRKELEPLVRRMCALFQGQSGRTDLGPTINDGGNRDFLQLERVDARYCVYFHQLLPPHTTGYALALNTR
jgi:hypothetical protein